MQNEKFIITWEMQKHWSFGESPTYELMLSCSNEAVIVLLDLRTSTILILGCCSEHTSSSWTNIVSYFAKLVKVLQMTICIWPCWVLDCSEQTHPPDICDENLVNVLEDIFKAFRSDSYRTGPKTRNSWGHRPWIYISLKDIKRT